MASNGNFELVSINDVELDGVLYTKRTITDAGQGVDTILSSASSIMTKSGQKGFVVIPTEGGFKIRLVGGGKAQDFVKPTVEEAVRPQAGQFVCLARKVERPTVVRNVSKGTVFQKTPPQEATKATDPGKLTIDIQGKSWTATFTRPGLKEPLVKTGSVEAKKSGQATIFSALYNALTTVKGGAWPTTVRVSDTNAGKILRGEMKSKANRDTVEMLSKMLAEHNATVE